MNVLKWSVVFLAFVAVGAFPLGSDAAIVNLDLQSTGVDGGGNALAIGAQDPEYVVLGSPDNDAYVVSKQSTWVTPTLNAQWISATPNKLGIGSETVYRYEIDLTNLYSASVSGHWATDDSAFIRLNGVDTVPLQSSAVYSALTYFEINSGFINNSVNYLDFVVSNISPAGPSGLLVNDIEGTANDVSPVPEPTALAIWGMMGGLGLIASRRRKRAA